MASLSVGMIEVEGYSVALATIDGMCKQTVIQVLAIDCNNPKSELTAEIPMTVQVIFQGQLSDVQEALRIGQQIAMKFISSKVISVAQLSKGAPGLEGLLTTGKVVPKYWSESKIIASIPLFTIPQALCLIEIQTYTSAINLANQLLHHYDLRYEHHESNLGGRLLTLIFSGSESQVTEAVEAIEKGEMAQHNRPLACIQLNKPSIEVLRYILKE